MSNKNDNMKKKIATGILIGTSITGIASSAVLAANTTSAIDDEVSKTISESVSTSSERSSRSRSKKSDRNNESSISKIPAKPPENLIKTKLTSKRYVFKHNRPGDNQPNLKENQFQHYFIGGTTHDYYGYVTDTTRDTFTVFIERFTVGNKLYYADKKSGNLLTGLQRIDGDLYYFGENQNNAYARQGWVTLGRDSYYFDKYGKATKGFKKIDDFTFYFDSNGKRVQDLQILEDGSMYYYKGGKKAFGFQTIDGKQFYFDKNKDGKAIKDDTIDIKDTMYEFDGNGVCIGMYKILN